MAPMQSRQLLVWTLPTIAVLLSYLWFKKKRINSKSDPGDNPIEERPSSTQLTLHEKTIAEELEEAAADISDLLTPTGSPFADRSFSRTLSGTESTPIDIIIPREHRSHKTSPVIISDEDLDFEIQKIKSMKANIELFKSDTVDSPHKSPQQQQKSPTIKKSPITFTKIKLDLNKTKTPAKTPKKMAQKDVVAVEEKLGSLKLETNNARKSVKGKTDEERQSSERDSANHSPADVMLASPSLSCISDNHSEGSSDSGKGGSDVATPPSRTPAGDGSISGDVNLPAFYEFVIPQTLVGRLIGRYGSFVAEIKDKTRAHIFIKKHPTSNKLKVCAIEGSQLDIDNALQMIREKFPVKRYAEITLEQVSFASQMNVPLTPDHLYLKLVEGINNDTIISCMVTPGHLFLQQPTHPSFPSLHILTTCMNINYKAIESPLLPSPVKENTICVAQSVGEWYRALILSVDAENDTSYVSFLDYGGFAVVENAKLRQIRGDFLLLPFQAAECVLANIKPIGGDDATWSDDAFTCVADITKGAIALTQIAEYTEDSIPLVLMYVVKGPQEVIFLNEELVNRGYAEFITNTIEDINEDLELEGAVGGLELVA